MATIAFSPFLIPVTTPAWHIKWASCIISMFCYRTGMMLFCKHIFYISCQYLRAFFTHLSLPNNRKPNIKFTAFFSARKYNWHAGVV